MEKKLLKEYGEWMKKIAVNCKYLKDGKASIPSSSPLCSLTNKVCDFELCPIRRKEER